MGGHEGCAHEAEQRGDATEGTLGDFDLGLFLETTRPMPRLALADLCPPFADKVLGWWQHWRETGEGLHPRALAIRDPSRPAAFVGHRLFAIVPRAHAPPLQFSFLLEAPEAILDLDLLHLARRPEAFLDRLDATPRVVVCTHGKGDPCCAVRGNAVFRTLRATTTHEPWQGSHFGGCRFAGNVWCLPSGNCHGHVAPEDADALVREDAAGRLWPKGFRGRIGQPPPEAAAETLLRRRHGAWGTAEILVQRLTARGEARWGVEADVRGEPCEDLLERIPEAGRFRLLCRAETPAAVPAWRLASR